MVQKEIMTNLSSKDIQVYLKNRYPVMFLDKVNEIILGKSAKGYKNFSLNEWFFVGHFEDHPNVPGFVQLEVMMQMFIMSFIVLPECRGMKTADAKVDNLLFKKELLPGDCLKVETELKSFRRGVAIGNAVGYVDNEIACSCELVVCVPDILARYTP